MITYTKAGDSTDVSVVIRIVDSSDGTPETGVTSATGGLALEYRREGAVSVGLTESDLSLLTDAHSDGGMLHIGNGYYRVDLPDAAVATGAAGVLVHGTATGMVVIGCYIQLVTYDNSGTDLSAVKTKTDSLTFTVANQVDANVASINEVTIIGDGSSTPFGV